MKRWTLCANMRPGCEGAPIVREGPPISLYDHIEVVPLADVRAVIEEYMLWEPGRRGHAAAHRRLRLAFDEENQP